MPEQCSKTSPKEIKCVREVYIKEMYFKETKSNMNKEIETIMNREIHKQQTLKSLAGYNQTSGLNPLEESGH